MKKYFNLGIIFVVIILIICSCGKKEEAPKAVPELEEIRNICDLATFECYYHNVAKSNKAVAAGIEHIFKTERTFWIEYTGKVKLGINMQKVDISAEDNVITITLPAATIIGDPMVIADTLNDESFIASQDNWINPNKITADDQTAAINQAQLDMAEAVNKNKSLLKQAQDRAKALIKNYIDRVGEMTGVQYTIKWNYIDEGYIDIDIPTEEDTESTGSVGE